MVTKAPVAMSTKPAKSRIHPVINAMSERWKVWAEPPPTKKQKVDQTNGKKCSRRFRDRANIREKSRVLCDLYVDPLSKERVVS